VLIDERSDVYSLGATLYFALVGKPPFDATSLDQLLALVRSGEPVQLRRIDPTIPGALETVCLRAMAKERERRYSSAKALSEDIDRALRGEPVMARPIGGLTRQLLWWRRRPRLAMTVTAGVLLVLASGGVGTTLALKARAARSEMYRRDRLTTHLRAAEKALHLAETKRHREGDFVTAATLADAAISEGDAAFALDPQCAGASFVLARAYALKAARSEDREALARAERYFAEAARLDPDAPEIYLDWARLYLGEYLLHARITLGLAEGRPRYQVAVSPNSAAAAERAQTPLSELARRGGAFEREWAAALSKTVAQHHAQALAHYRTIEAQMQTDVQGLIFYTISLGVEGQLVEADRVATTAIP
jgi:tetratricopeptide (TPR) repeat protein